ncbi:hypothetical protein AVEN_152290-1 [Araneus ventricosus]|uniref:Mos1 transposase HTH domain-containing protein n=1 Tax=Araneus ventricosus TaxID=182803 RepID=A0A4Y2KA69_ARAVE|nr:hypothetical protein AVEN_152290-1 [Araneus ventricosus]
MGRSKAKKNVNVWCQQFKDGRTDLKGDQEKKRGRPRTTHTDDNFWKIERWVKEILQHPPYIPDLAPSDFHFFVTLGNAWLENSLRIWSTCKTPF